MGLCSGVAQCLVKTRLAAGIACLSCFLMACMASWCALSSSCSPLQTLTMCLWEVDRTSLGRVSGITYVYSFCVTPLSCHLAMMVCLVTSLQVAATSCMLEMPYQNRPAYT